MKNRTIRLLAVSVALVVVTAGPAMAAPALDEMTTALDGYRGALRMDELRDINAPYDRAAEHPHAVERWRPIVELEFPEEWVDWALRIISCESKGDPTAKNRRSSAAGLFQFLKRTWDWVAEETGSPTYREGGPYDAYWNIRNAAWLLDQGGPKHWQCKARR